MSNYNVSSQSMFLTCQKSLLSSFATIRPL